MNDPIEISSNNFIQVKSADQKHCFSCSNILHISAKQCPKCGAEQPETSKHQNVVFDNDINKINLTNQQVFCRGCGAVIHISAVACPKCGAPQFPTQNNNLTESRNKTTAGMLGIFLGSIGVHKFYMGSMLLGVLYLLFFWTLIPGIIGFIEGVYYLTLSDQEFNRKYN